MRLPPAVVPAAGALVAVAATGIPAVLYGHDPDVVNLAVGLVLLVAGAQLMALQLTRTAGVLLVLTSVVWFVPDLALDVPMAGSLLGAATLSHVVPLVAAVLVAPEGRLLRRIDVAVVLLAVVAAVSAVTGGYRALMPVCGVALLVAVSADGWLRRAMRTRSARAYLVAVVAVALALTGVPLARTAMGGGSERWLFAIYGSLLSIAAMALVRAGPWLRRAAALDVGPDAVAALDDLLAEVSGDPNAHAVVRVDEDHWVRLDGRPAAQPATSSETVVVVSNRTVPFTLQEMVAEGLRLAADNVLARRLVDERVRALATVRTRLVRVEEEERAGLVAQLRRGPLSALIDLGAHLADEGARETLLEHVRDTRRDLEQVASGLDPLDGFVSVAGAVRGLCKEFGASADVDLEVVLNGMQGRALWYACSEALTNSSKHAPDSLRQVRLVREPTQVILVVRDDGPGPGAALDAGLLGVRDRLAAVGGTIAVTHALPGTRVEASVPTTRHHIPGTGVPPDASHPTNFLALTPPNKEVSP